MELVSQMVGGDSVLSREDQKLVISAHCPEARFRKFGGDRGADLDFMRMGVPDATLPEAFERVSISLIVEAKVLGEIGMTEED